MHILNMSDGIPFRSVTIKAASTVLKERISKYAVSFFFLKIEKRGPVARTAGSELISRGWVTGTKLFFFFASRSGVVSEKHRESAVFFFQKKKKSDFSEVAFSTSQNLLFCL